MADLNLQARGLWLQGNSLDAPPGAMSQADDVVISRDNIVEPRRGGYAMPGAPGLRRIFPYKSVLIGIDAAGHVYADATVNGYSGWGAGPPAGGNNRWVEQNGRLYLGGSQTIIRGDTLPAASGSVRAGIPPALDVQLALVTGAMLQNTYAVGYRAVWGTIASNGDVMRGPPSGTATIVNGSGSAKAVQLTTTAPTIGYYSNETNFLEVYRSVTTSAATPSEEMGLVYTQQWSGTGPPATVTFTDTVDDSLIGAALYTSPSQEGIGAANTAPPFALDLATYRNSVFYANATQIPRISARLLGCGAPGLQAGDTVTVGTQVGTITVTAGAAENIGTNTFYVDTTSTSSQMRVANTTDSLIRVINRGTWSVQRQGYAYLLSAATDPAGIIGFEPIGTGFDINFSCSRAGAFLQAAVSKTWASMNQANALYWSKGQQPEAVPLLNFATIGSSDKKILRIVPTRDSLFIFKEDGLWRLTGDAAPWTIAPFDPTCLLKAPESAVMLNNSVFALTNQGVVQVTDTGVQVVSRNIETAILPLIAPGMLSRTASLAFGVAYESARKYYLWLPATNGSTTCDGGAYVYDLFTQTWVHDTRPALHAIVNPADSRLYIVDGTYLWQERKDFADTDYVDTLPISANFTFLARCGNTPGSKHHFTVLSAFFRKLLGTSFSLSFDTELTTPTQTTYNVADYNLAPGQPFTLRTLVPLEQSRGSQLTIGFSQSVNQTPFQFQGMSLLYRATSEEAGY